MQISVKIIFIVTSLLISLIACFIMFSTLRQTGWNLFQAPYLIAPLFIMTLGYFNIIYNLKVIQYIKFTEPEETEVLDMEAGQRKDELPEDFKFRGYLWSCAVFYGLLMLSIGWIILRKALEVFPLKEWPDGFWNYITAAGFGIFGLGIIIDAIWFFIINRKRILRMRNSGKTG